MELKEINKNIKIRNDLKNEKKVKKLKYKDLFKVKK
jgi:hypothetical protein